MLTDLILVALLILNILLGLKRGFFEMLGRLVLLLLSLAATLLLLGPLTSLLADAPFFAPLVKKLGDVVLTPLQNTASNIGAAVDSFGLPPILARLMQSELPTPDSSITQAYPEFTAVLFKFALNAAIFILMFAVVSIVIHFAARSLTRFSDSLPVLGTANRLGGLVAGLALGLVQITIILLAMGFLAPYVPFFADQISTSKIAEQFFAIDILTFLL